MKRYHVAILCFLIIIIAVGGNPGFAQSPDQPLVAREKISLEFVNADLQHVLRLLAKQNGLNIITNDRIQGRVTVNFTGVSLQSALDAILLSNGYNYVISDDIIIVKEVQREMQGEIETRIYELDYVDARDIVVPLESALTEDKGSIDIFSRSMERASGGTSVQASQNTARRTNPSNVLVISDIPSNFPKIEALIGQLDTPAAQVMIGVKFIETRLDHEDTRGINWTIKARLQGGPPRTATNGTNSQTGYTGQTGTNTTGTMGFPVFGDFQQLDMATLSLQEFQVVLDMLFTEGNSRLLSDPRITTMDNQPAEISVSTTIPILVPQPQSQQSGGGGFAGIFQPVNTFEEEEISISLNVLPQVNTDRYITMSVEPMVEAITGFTGPNQDRPIVASRSAKTQVMIQDGETIAIGGLIKEDKIETKKKVPLLGDIPLLGQLFRYRSEQIEKTDLLIFITPRIVGPHTENVSLEDNFHENQ